MPAPPTVWRDALDFPARKDFNIDCLRFLSTGATMIPIELMRRLRRDTNIKVLSTGYGMTECCGSATQTLPDDDIERVATTVGKAIPDTEIRVADLDGKSVPIGQSGEVLIRDAKLLLGYLEEEGAIVNPLDAEGWLHSGDAGVLDERGYLKIIDRLKDMFIAGGFNVYPAEIERQLAALEGIQCCAVVGRRDQRLGEVGHAFVVRSAGSTLTEQEILAWSKANLANYKVPRGVTFLDALPMNSTGKVVKAELRKLL